jgi:hypothetical protein
VCQCVRSSDQSADYRKELTVDRRTRAFRSPCGRLVRYTPREIPVDSKQPVVASSFVVTVTSDGCFSLLIGAEVGDILFLSLSLSFVGLSLFLSLSYVGLLKYDMIRYDKE